jgi:conjugative relaxase-like TrwC/TraI family protein
LGVHGGVKVYRGNPSAARSYVEADNARVDDYYLAEGTGLAVRFVATPEGGVEAAGPLDGDGYEAWVAGLDPASGEPRGRLRTDANAVRFVEVVVNGPKTWSLAAALDPEIAEAYDAAQDRAAREIVGWLAQHATTRVGPRGGQLQVPVERIEAAAVRHYTSRAGDPHRHLHLQVNARVWAEGAWRGLHTVGVRDSIDALNGIGHAAVMCDPQFRSVLAARGFSLDPDTGEVSELAGFVGAFSVRARQIAANIDRYETDWRETHPGQEPGPELLRGWDRRAWAQARPDKVVPTDGGELTDRWVEELHRLGFRDPARPTQVLVTKTGSLDRDAAVQVVVSRLGARRSAWNAADIRGQVELLIAGANVVAEPAVRTELAEDLTARVLDQCVRLLEEVGTPEHIRALTSREVLAVEADLSAAFATRASGPARCARVRGGQLDAAQLRAVEALVGTHRLVVLEGAAGAGKTATLAATRTLLAQRGHRLVVATPTLKAAQIATGQAGLTAFSAAWLASQHGFQWNADGRWTREAHDPDAAAVLARGDLLLVDEAGMLDQDTARALVAIADETGARLALVGDRHQLPAVGRGGVLDLAARWAHPDACLMLGAVHRFADPAYAELSLAMRTGERPGAVFDQLVDRGQIVIHVDEVACTAALADAAAATGALVVADTREQVADLNHAIRRQRVAEGTVDDTRVLVTRVGERIGVGDKVATRRNDYDLGVANRDTWTVTALDDGTLHLAGKTGERTLPVGYAAAYVELAYATTCYGAQGETVPTAHLVLGEHTGAASAYVAMTRGRENNTAHLVADSLEDARRQWIQTFARDRADLGPAHAAKLAARESAKYLNGRPLGRGRYVPRKRRPSSARPAPGGSPLATPASLRDPGRGPGIGF